MESVEDKKFKLKILKTYNKKLIAFIDISDDSWAFGLKDSFTSAFTVNFIFRCFCDFNSFLKLGQIEKEMKNL